MNPYRVLGLAPTATAAEIRDAYRRRAKVTHPDAGGSAAEFDRLTEAYDTLADPGRRFAYDRSIARGDAADGASMDEHRMFEDMWQPPGRRRDRNSSRIGNLAVSLVGGTAFAAVAIVLRFGGSPTPGPPTPISCAAVRSVAATYVLIRTGTDVHPRVTLRNVRSGVQGVAVAFVVTVLAADPQRRTPDRTLVFGSNEPPVWAARGRSIVDDLRGVVIPTVDRVQPMTATATATTVGIAATSLPAGGCPIPVRPEG